MSFSVIAVAFLSIWKKMHPRVGDAYPFNAYPVIMGNQLTFTLAVDKFALPFFSCVPFIISNIPGKTENNRKQQIRKMREKAECRGECFVVL